MVEPRDLTDRSIEQKLDEISNHFQRAMAEVEREQEQYWNSLTKDQQLAVFCSVVRRIYQAEIVDRGTYRWALYDVFKFGPESYVPAQCAGYLDIHNMIFSKLDEENLLKRFCKASAIEGADEKIKSFLGDYYGTF